MSYSVVQPGPKKRPGVVTAASALLYLCAGLLLIGVLIAAVQIGPVREAVNDVIASEPGLESASGFVVFAIVAVMVVYALLAVGFATLGVLVGRGKQPARIVTWVVAGLGVLCLGCGQISTAMGSIGSTPESDQLADRIAAATPSWQVGVGTAVDIISLLALIAVIILLALPAANDFFRKEQEVWVPPTTWPGDPSGGVPPYQPPAPGIQPPPYSPPGQPPYSPPGQPPYNPPGQPPYNPPNPPAPPQYPSQQ